MAKAGGKSKNILRMTFIQFFFVYSLLVLIISFKDPQWQHLNFLLFSVLLGILGIFALGDKGKDLKFSKAWILVPLVLTIVIRVIPFIGNPIPLGYDVGMYKYMFEEYRDSLPNIPEQSLEEWVRATYPAGLPTLASILYSIGLDTQSIMVPLYIFFSSLTILSVYLASKEYFSEQAGIMSAFIFSISYAQFSTFSLFYYKNIIALNLLLLFMYCLKRNKNIFLEILFATSTAFIHRPTFLILGLVWAFETLANRKDFRKNILAMAISFILILGIYLPRFELAIMDVIKPSITNPGGGTFMQGREYELFSLSYLSLAIIGLFYALRARKFNPIIYWFFINSAIVVFRLIFFQRFMIHLDIAIIILASLGAYRFIKTKEGPFRFIILALLLIGGLVVCLRSSIQSEPLITQENLTPIGMISNHTPEDAYIVSMNSYYSPWLQGYSGRRIIAPGLFSYDMWNVDEWKTFWDAKDYSEIEGLVYMLPKPLYFYVGNDKSLIFMPREKFEDGCFREVYENNGNQLFEFVC